MHFSCCDADDNAGMPPQCSLRPSDPWRIESRRQTQKAPTQPVTIDLTQVCRFQPVQEPIKTGTNSVGLIEQRWCRLRPGGRDAQRANAGASDLTFTGDQRMHRIGRDIAELEQFVQGARRRAAARLHRLIKFRRQIEQSEVMGHARQIHSDPPGDCGVRLACIDAALDEARELERRQGKAHLVFRDLRVGICGRITHDHRNALQASLAGCTPPARAEVNPMAAARIRGMDDDWLQDATLADVVNEVVEIRIEQVRARIVGILVDQRDGYVKRSPIGTRRCAR